jgi:hypothetical protein
VRGVEGLAELERSDGYMETGLQCLSKSKEQEQQWDKTGHTFGCFEGEG